ncbi:MAG: hypothetical protein J5993_03325 [Clostridia bacterium]|nr:hypothetical protein [Clostridia bacterium]
MPHGITGCDPVQSYFDSPCQLKGDNSLLLSLPSHQTGILCTKDREKSRVLIDAFSIDCGELLRLSPL